MVRRVFKSVRLPIIGMGGISNVSDALEFIICGATAIACGTVNFVQPAAAEKIAGGIDKYLKRNKIKEIKQLIGSLKP